VKAAIGKAPNSNNQAPEKHQSSNPKAHERVVIVRYWSLELLLGFGAWVLVLRLAVAAPEISR
jgi:hypothetical protein